MIAISEKILGMLTYWERDDLLIKKAKISFNNLSTQKKKSEYGKEVQNKLNSCQCNKFFCF